VVRNKGVEFLVEQLMALVLLFEFVVDMLKRLIAMVDLVSIVVI